MLRIARLIRPVITKTTRSTVFKSQQLWPRRASMGSTRAPSQHRATHAHAHPHAPSRAVEGPIVRAYQELIQRGEYRLDPAQLHTLQLLQGLADEIDRYTQHQGTEPAPASGWWSRVKALVQPQPVEARAPRGLYIWGGVGCGKTMLMDLFLQHVRGVLKTRVHFNSFMQSVHLQLHAYRTQQEVKSDPLDYVVTQIRSQTQLLCFDEFQVTNIADAMLLGRLFAKLWQQHVIVVATSNRPPDDLYKGGLQRALFLPFIAQLKQRCHVHHMGSPVDYRLVGARMQHIYHVIDARVPEQTAQLMEEQWNQLTEHRPGEASEVPIGYGRVLRVGRALKGIAWFEFGQLCDNAAALGVADYAKLCELYHTLFLAHVPRMTLEHVNEARRFILLIDECYDHKVKLIISAHVEAEQLFPRTAPSSSTGTPVTGEEEMFAFERTLSRLHEMQTTEYLEHKHEPHPYKEKTGHKRHGK